MKKLMVIIIVLISCSVRATYDPIEDAIRHSDPEKLQRMCIPGFAVSTEDKHRYMHLASEMVTATYQEIQKNFTWADGITILKSSLKVAVGVGILALMRQFLKKGHSWGIWDQEELQPVSPHITYTVNGILGIIGITLLASGTKGIYKGYMGDERLIKHNKALAVEAIIYKLSCCEIRRSMRKSY
jgi:hypothetical protein